MHNKYIFDARISERKFIELLTMFCADVPALTASGLTLINRKTSQCIYTLLRKRVVEIAMEEAKPFTGEVEIDESYFGPRRVRGRRGRGAGGKPPSTVCSSVVARCSPASSQTVRVQLNDPVFPEYCLMGSMVVARSHARLLGYAEADFLPNESFTKWYVEVCAPIPAPREIWKLKRRARQKGFGGLMPRARELAMEFLSLVLGSL